MLASADLFQYIWQPMSQYGPYAAAIRETVERAMEQQVRGVGLARLPSLLYQGFGGEGERAAPLVVAWQVLRYAARLLDDIEDGERQDSAAGLNIATGLIFSAGRALNCLERAGVAPTVSAEVRDNFYATLLQIGAGQHLDLTLEEPTLDRCWQIASMKSGAFTALICWASARLATEQSEQLALCRRFGHHLGLLDQIRDDLTDLWSADTSDGDLRRAHNWGLPATYALAVLAPDERQQLLRALEGGCDDAREEEERARELIVRSGAAVYLVVQSTIYYMDALKMIEAMAVPQDTRCELQSLLDCLQPIIGHATPEPS